MVTKRILRSRGPKPFMLSETSESHIVEGLQRVLLLHKDKTDDEILMIYQQLNPSYRFVDIRGLLPKAMDGAYLSEVPNVYRILRNISEKRRVTKQVILDVQKLLGAGTTEREVHRILATMARHMQ